MTGVSTHILDTARGRPAAGVPVNLDLWAAGGWQQAGASVTGTDGRARDLLTRGLSEPATGRLVFAVRDYLAAHHGQAFFPEVNVVFTLVPGESYHLPLLLTTYGYTVYRGG